MSSVQKAAERVLASVGAIVVGKNHQIRLALACLLARGHLLIEDLPGMGKTTLAQALAGALGLNYSRIQFTSDLLPADIVGVSVYDRNNGAFEFHPGPVFSNLVLADEINRTTPKTQSALLEAMAEGQVSVEGETRRLPAPFFVIATQNPNTQFGTFPLPESQLDRFLMCIELGYPDPTVERQLLSGADPRLRLAQLQACVTMEQLLDMQGLVSAVKVSGSLIDYVQRLVAYTRGEEGFEFGLSPRAAMAVVHSARAWSLIHGRQYVIPEDVQAVFLPVATHRLLTRDRNGERVGQTLLERGLNSVDIL